MSITNKLLLFYLTNIFIFIGYIGYNYTFTNNAIAKIKNTQEKILPISILQSKNLYLLETLITMQSDAIITNEIDMLKNVVKIKNQIIQNLDSLANIDNKNNIKKQKQIFNDYFKVSYNISKKLIYQQNVTQGEFKKLANLSKDVLVLFKKQKQYGSKHLVDNLDQLSNQTNKFFNSSFFIALFALVFITLFSIYLYNWVKNRFSQALKSLKDSISNKNKPIYNDEISKFQQYYNKLFLEKTKAQTLTKIKSQFLSHISHEIRTPMNGIISMTYLLQQTKLDNKQKNYLNAIQSSSSVLLQIVNDVLDINKIEAGKLELNMQEFDIDELMTYVNNIVKYKAIEKGLNYNITYSDNLPQKIIADRLRISQILINIISNGIKFTHDGYIDTDLALDNNNLKITIKDSGIGISKDELNKLFKPFTQASKQTATKYGGSGLGLNIVKQLLDLMNGSIEVKSTPNKGTIFYITIPIKLLHNTKLTVAQSKIVDFTNTKSDETTPISNKKLDNLLNELKQAALTHRTKNCKKIITQFEQLNLDNYELKLTQELANLVKNREFNKIIAKI
jgi:signal transduction histidine kinase